MTLPRVFYIGETVPAGVCVVDQTGDILFLDDTALCSCDRGDDELCEECSYDVVWAGSPVGVEPLVEFRPLEYYTQAVGAEDLRRSLLASVAALRTGGAP